MSMYAQGCPHIVKGEPGKTVFICRCGNTANPPYCDGSHNKLENVTPHQLAMEDNKNQFICGCGKSKKLPFCDGSHNR